MKLSQILVIDRNEVDVSLMEKTISDSESIYKIFTVNTADNGLEFLFSRKTEIEETLPNLVILSDVVDDSSALAFVEKLKSDESLRVIPIVIFTDPINEDAIKKLYERNASCFVQKPKDFDSFLKTLNSLQKFWLNIVSLPQTY